MQTEAIHSRLWRWPHLARGIKVRVKHVPPWLAAFRWGERWQRLGVA